MVVCKFFLQGSCRFGEHCKFDHEISSENLTSNQSFAGVQQSPNDVDINVLIKSVRNDMLALEKSGQWLLSCYAPFKEKQLIPGFHDQSFEEVRLGCYEANKTNTSQNYNIQLQQALSDAKKKFKSLQSPSTAMINLLRNIYNAPASGTSIISENIGSEGKSLMGRSPLNNDNIIGQVNSHLTTGNSSNIFANCNTQKSEMNNSIFAQNFTSQGYTGSLFGQQNGETNGSFGKANIDQSSNNQLLNIHSFNQASENIFSNQPLKPVQQQNIFVSDHQNQTQSKNIFSGMNQPTSNNFYEQNNHQPQMLNNSIFPSNSIFNQNTQSSIQTNSYFDSNKTSSNRNSIFGSVSAQTGNSPLYSNLGDTKTYCDKSLYSKAEDLSESDNDWFKNNNNIDISNIPEKPPTYEMCYG